MKFMSVFAVLVFCLLAGTQSAAASCSLSSARIGQKLIKTGDTDRKVLEADPDRRVRLETRSGGAAGYRYEFHRYGRTVHIYARGGRIVRVCRYRE